MLARATEFVVGTWQYDSEDVSPQADHGFSVPCHHQDQHDAEACRFIQLPVEEAVFLSASTALIEADARPRMLEISHITDIEDQHMVESQLESLNLSELDRLLFNPQTPPRNVFLGEAREDNWLDRLQRANGRAMMQSIRRGWQSLKNFQISKPACVTAILFPPKETIALPLLQSLSLDAGVDLGALALLIDCAPKLQQLDICPELAVVRWLDLWRAVHQHVNNLRVNCQIWSRQREDFFKHENCTRGEESGPRDECTISLAANTSVVNYISKRGDWNQDCMMIFST